MREVDTNLVLLVEFPELFLLLLFCGCVCGAWLAPLGCSHHGKTKTSGSESRQKRERRTCSSPWMLRRALPSLETHCCNLLTSKLQQAEKDSVLPAAESKPVAALSAAPSSSIPQVALFIPYRHFLSTQCCKILSLSPPPLSLYLSFSRLLCLSRTRSRSFSRCKIASYSGHMHRNPHPVRLFVSWLTKRTWVPAAP